MTIQERQKMIDDLNLTVDEMGTMTDSEGGIHNPWCYEWFNGKEWLTIVGIEIELGPALLHLFRLKRDNPHLRYRMYRANDLDIYTVYTD